MQRGKVGVWVGNKAGRRFAVLWRHAYQRAVMKKGGRRHHRHKRQINGTKGAGGGQAGKRNIAIAIGIARVLPVPYAAYSGAPSKHGRAGSVPQGALTLQPPAAVAQQAPRATPYLPTAGAGTAHGATPMPHPPHPHHACTTPHHSRSTPRQAHTTPKPRTTHHAVRPLQVLALDFRFHPRHTVLHVWDGTDAFPVPPTYTNLHTPTPPGPALRGRPPPQLQQQQQYRHQDTGEVLYIFA